MHVQEQCKYACKLTSPKCIDDDWAVKFQNIETNERRNKQTNCPTSFGVRVENHELK